MAEPIDGRELLAIRARTARAGYGLRQSRRQTEQDRDALLREVYRLRTESGDLRSKLAAIRQLRVYSNSSMGRVYDYVKGSDLDGVLEPPHSPAEPVSPVSTPTEAHGETGEAQEARE